MSLAAVRDQSLSDKKEQHVVIDALNYLSTFMPISEPMFAGAEPWTLVREMATRVYAFIDGCKRSGITPHFVIDCGFESEEALLTWMGRREKEVVEGERRMPHNADVILAALMLQRGADVLRPVNLDGDDVVVRLAVELDCPVVSNDTDMMRYKELSHSKIMVGWLFKQNGCVEFIRRTYFRMTKDKEGLPPRSIQDLPFEPERWRQEAANDKFVAFAGEGHMYRRGNSDSYTKLLGNLHQLAQPLRRAVYASEGVAHVDEMYPIWDRDTGQPAWYKDTVTADASLAAVLDGGAAAALAWLIKQDEAADVKLQGRDRKWRAFARVMMAAELVNVLGDGNILKVLVLAAEIDSDPAINVAMLQEWASEAPPKPWYPPEHLQYKTCRDCAQPNYINMGELEFFWGKGFNLPPRCKSCRAARKK